MNNQYKIFLPQWIWDSENNDEFKVNLSKYMRRSYPEATVTRLEKPFAICSRG